MAPPAGGADGLRMNQALADIISLQNQLTAVCLSGIDFKIRTIELDGKKIKLQIW